MMRRPQLLIGLFLLATLLVDLAVVRLGPNLRASEISGIVLLALYFSQIALAAIWLGLGQTSFPLRLVVVFFLLIAWNAVIFLRTGEGEDFYRLIVLTAMISMIVAIPLMAARLFGLRLANVRSDSVKEAAAAETPRYQYSILSMFGLMTGVALLLGVLQYTFVSDLAPCHLIVTHCEAQVQAGAHTGCMGCALGWTRTFAIAMASISESTGTDGCSCACCWRGHLYRGSVLH